MSDSNVFEVQHPLVCHHLGQIRAVDTAPASFRRHIRCLAMLLVSEATKDLPTEEYKVTTPITETVCRRIAGRIAAVPILRAGLGMVDSLTDVIPEVEVWHLGLYRDEATAQPVRYYDKLPKDNPPDVAFVVDPMLATGGSAIAAIDTLKSWGINSIQMLSIISAPEGVAALQAAHPDVSIYTCSIDECLNEQKYIVPGLGDAGDRIFNT